MKYPDIVKPKNSNARTGSLVGNRSLIFKEYFIGKTYQIENIGKKINPLFSILFCLQSLLFLKVAGK